MQENDYLTYACPQTTRRGFTSGGIIGVAAPARDQPVRIGAQPPAKKNGDLSVAISII